MRCKNIQSGFYMTRVSLYLLTGCENFVAMDGIWKLRFPHCMFPVKAEVCGVPALNLPSVCTEEPRDQNSALCKKHCAIATEKGIPTKLRDFIHTYCGVPWKGK